MKLHTLNIYSFNEKRMLPVVALVERKTLRLGHRKKASIFSATLALPVFGGSGLAADGFPGLAFAILFVEVL